METELIASGGAVKVYSSGTLTSQTDILSGAIIQRGSNDSLKVSSGGSVIDTVVCSSGNFHISSGGTIQDCTVSRGGYLYLSSGAAADGLYITGSSVIYISGSAANTEIFSGGSIRIQKNGVMDNTILNGGKVRIYEGGIVRNIHVSSAIGGEVTLSAGGQLSGLILESKGKAYLHQYGTATEIKADSGAILGLDVAPQASFQGTYGGKTFEVKNGTLNGGYEIHSGCYVSVFGGGKTSDISVLSGGKYYLLDGSHKGSLQIADGAIVSANAGNTIEFTVAGRSAEDPYLINNLALITGAPVYTVTISENQAYGTYKLAQGAENFTGTLSIGTETLAYGSLTVNGAGLIRGQKTYSLVRTSGNLLLSVSSKSIFQNEAVMVYSSGILTSQMDIVSQTLLQDGGNNSMVITSGGDAYGTIVNQNASMHVNSGGAASGTIISGIGGFIPSSGAMYVSGGWAEKTSVLENGKAVVTAGTMYDTTVTGGFFAAIDQGETSKTELSGNALFQVSSGGTAWETSVSGKASCLISDNGVTYDTEILSGGKVIIFNDGLADRTTVHSGGEMTISGDHTHGSAADTTVSSGGRLSTQKQAYLLNTEIKSGAELYCSDTAILAGTQMFGGSIFLTQSMNTESAEITLDLSSRTGNDSFIVNHLMYLNTEHFSVSVTANQKHGIYKLADQAGNYGGTITVTADNRHIGTVSAGGTLFNGNTAYTLKLDNNALCLHINDRSELLPENLRGDQNGLSWSAVPGAEGYIVEYSRDQFATVITLKTTSTQTDSLALPSGTYQWRVKAIGGAFAEGNSFISVHNDPIVELLVSDSDSNPDLFFANPDGIWEEGYKAQHTGILNGWTGTGEYAEIAGKNNLSDVYEGSADANILIMTDKENGDVLFVDDIYSNLPKSLTKPKARIAKINEIRAGAGDDIVDMTSQRFSYSGNGVTIYGGLGNDTIWANNGSNTLFGDAGNDRIVGGMNNDSIIGGAGNDSLHGGGGNDTFFFGGNWGSDTVEQVPGGKIVLWFEQGSALNWNQSTLTYTDGSNSVTVSGVSADNVTLRFGETGNSIPAGAFLDAASEQIFENNQKGMIA